MFDAGLMLDDVSQLPKHEASVAYIVVKIHIYPEMETISIV
jgi:hypothetical protein